MQPSTAKGTSAEAEAIVHEIQARIATGQWQPGQRLPSERDLASEFNVSRSLIQTAIDRLGSLGLVDQLPNCRPTVRSLGITTRRKAGLKRNQIALWIHPNSEDLGASTILRGIRNALGSAGYLAVIGCPESPQAESEEAFLKSLPQSPSVAGAIIWPSAKRGIAAYEDLIKGGLPTVFVDREPPETVQVDLVATNNRRAAKMAVQHLIDLGHRGIAVVTNSEDVSSVRERVDGYRTAMLAAGLAIEPPLTMPIGVGSDAADCAKRIVKQLIEVPQRPTAIFAVNDQAAMHLHDAIESLGMKVPEEFSLVGFDWFMRWVPSGGHITTVCQHFEEIGRIAVDRLLERIDSRQPQTPRHILVEAPLVLKGSTAPPLFA